MKLQNTFLRSKVGQRVFLLFISCAAAPVATLAIISFYQVSHQLKLQSERELRQSSKSIGMAILERLETLDAELKAIAPAEARHEPSAAYAELTEQFQAITVFDGHGRPTVLFGPGLKLPKFNREEKAALEAGKAILRMHDCSASGGRCLELVRNGQAKVAFAVAEINQDYLWPVEVVPADFGLSVFGPANTRLTGAAQSVPPHLSNHAGGTSADPERSFEWTADRTRYDAAYWQIFLASDFHSNAWTVVVSRQHDEFMAPALQFRNSFPPVVLLTVWIVALLSLVQIRRTLVPLEKLKEATGQLRAQHFECRVEVNSNDEFQELAASFNSMGLQLGKQFEALKAIHEIDRHILGSLNREGTMDAVLDRMPNLYTCHGFAIALINDRRFPAGASLNMILPERGLRQVAGTLFLPADLRQVTQNPEWFACGGAHEEAPSFLQPLHQLGLISFQVFPIFLEHDPYAALVYAHSSEMRMEESDLQHGRQVADQLAVAFSNVQLIEALEQLHWGTLTALARAIDAKSAWTAGHSERVTRLALKIGQKMQLSSRDLKIMHRGGLLHDIGKIGTPPAVLDKAGQLDADEVRVMRDHVQTGLRILEPIPGLGESLPIVAQHHERFDGSGYPLGIAGENISLYARIFAVADAYDAMTSDRPYRKGLPVDEAIARVRQSAGRQFDPAVVESFLHIVETPAESSDKSGGPEHQLASAKGQGV